MCMSKEHTKRQVFTRQTASLRKVFTVLPGMPKLVWSISRCVIVNWSLLTCFIKVIIWLDRAKRWEQWAPILSAFPSAWCIRFRSLAPFFLLQAVGDNCCYFRFPLLTSDSGSECIGSSIVTEVGLYELLIFILSRYMIERKKRTVNLPTILFFKDCRTIQK